MPGIRTKWLCPYPPDELHSQDKKGAPQGSLPQSRRQRGQSPPHSPWHLKNHPPPLGCRVEGKACRQQAVPPRCLEPWQMG